MIILAGVCPEHKTTNGGGRMLSALVEAKPQQGRLNVPCRKSPVGYLDYPQPGSFQMLNNEGRVNNRSDNRSMIVQVTTVL